MNRNTLIMNAEQMLLQDYPQSLIVKGYNSIKPLPRGYTLKISDPWCAAFTSFMLWKVSGGDQKLPYECSCKEMVDKAKTLKMWVEDESVKPLPGWVVVYDWNDKGKPKDNKGWPDHVGIVTEVSDASFKVIEGNYNNRIGKRAVKINARGLRGFIAIPFDDNKEKSKSIDDIAHEVICGLWGYGKTRKERLTDAGYDYNAVQKRVNELLTK